VALAGGEPQSAQDPAAGSIQQIDRRSKYAQVPLEGPRYQQSYGPSTLQTEAFRDQLAQYDVQNRQQQKCHGE